MYCDGRCQYLNERKHKCELTGEKLTYMKQTGSISFSVHEHRGVCKGKRWNAMENRFLYRAKRIDNGIWVYGLPSYDTDGEIREIEAYEDADVEFYAVDPSTICQCTAMPDKNNKLIFENDIAIKHNDDDKEPYLIRWSENYAAWELAQCGCAMYGFFDVDFGEIEVIGNAIDNPELLEV